MGLFSGGTHRDLRIYEEWCKHTHTSATRYHCAIQACDYVLCAVSRIMSDLGAT